MPNPPVIAVVDDDEAMREALFEFLQVIDLPCRVFERADAFLAAYAPGLFSCLITDIRMPGLSGLELQQRLKSLRSPLPVIFVTSSGDASTRSRAMAEGAIAYLTKPVCEDDLIHYLKVALHRDGSDNNSDDDRGPSKG